MEVRSEPKGSTEFMLCLFTSYKAKTYNLHLKDLIEWNCMVLGQIPGGSDTLVAAWKAPFALPSLCKNMSWPF